MLYVFLVNTGTMLTFEMNFAMQCVRDLQDVIARQCRIPQEKQVLLISGGDSLDPGARVCRYASGTDTNPIFLFSKQAIESTSAPSASVNYGTESHLKDRVDDSMTLPSSYETLVARTELAANFFEVAKEEYRICKHLLFDQHLQHQGWLAVIANLEDITNAFKAKSNVFLQYFDEFLAAREESTRLVLSFPSVLELLAKIPLLQSLVVCGLADVSVMDLGSRPKTLLEWISAQDANNMLEQMMQQCQTELEQFSESMKEALVKEVELILMQINDATWKEVGGLDKRLSYLDQRIEEAAKLVKEQEQIFKSIENNQASAFHVRDPSILPELCDIHKHQVPQLLKNQDLLQQIKTTCIGAKANLAENLHKRLKWVVHVERGLSETDSRIFVCHESLKKLRRRLEIIRQISSSPAIYCRTVSEVVRRKLFSRQFVTFATGLSGRCSKVHCDELARREEFDNFFQHHFLKALFPGLEDVPPLFATKCPEPFDDRLPQLTEDDISFLQSQVPELSESLRILDGTSVSVVELLRNQATDDLIADDVLDKRKVLDVENDVLGREAPLEISSQSVEIITAEESRLVELEAFQVTAAAAAAAPIVLCVDPTSCSKTEGEKKSGNASAEASPETEENPVHDTNDTFMTADFYIDESMPSSMTELASSKKELFDCLQLAELQGILQDRTAQLELKEREVCDNKRCIEELNARLSQYERTRKLMSEVVVSCCGPLKEDLEMMKSSVVMNRSQSFEELHAVHNNLAELVRTWNAASEQIALDTQTDATRKLDDRLVVLQEKLDSDSVILQDYVSENEKLKDAVDEKTAQCRLLADELEKLKAESDSSKKILLEVELESDRLRADHKIETDKKDDLIAALEKTADETGGVLKARDDALEELLQKFEMEKLEMAETLKKEQTEKEETLAEEIRRNLGLKHQEEVDDIRKEFERQLNEERGSVERLTEDCRHLTEKQEELVKESSSTIEELQKNHDVQMKTLKEECSVALKELENSQILINELNLQIQQCNEKTEELKDIIEKSAAVKPDSDKTMQTEETEEPSAGRVTDKTLSEAEVQTEYTERVNTETQVESVAVTTDISDGCHKSLQDEVSARSMDKVCVESESQTEQPDKIAIDDAVVQTDDLQESMDVPSNAEILVTNRIQGLSDSCSAREYVDCAVQGDDTYLTEASEKSMDKVCVESESQTTEQLCKAVVDDAVVQTEDLLDILPLNEKQGVGREYADCPVQADDIYMTGFCELRSSSELSLTAAPCGEQGNDLELQLRVDDYLPLQRHVEIVARLKADLEDDKRVAVQTAVEEVHQLNDKHVEALLQKHDIDRQLLKSNFEAERQIIFNEALNRALSERDRQIEELQKTINYLHECGAGKSEASSQSAGASVQDSSVSRYVQGKLEDELAEAKQEILRLQSQLRLQSSCSFGQSFMGQSVMTQSIPQPSDVSERKKSLGHPDPVRSQQDCEKLKEKLMHLSITGRSLDIVMQYVNMYSCHDGDVTLFIWNADLGHYLAYLATDGPEHFLHADCVGLIDSLDSELKEAGKWMIAEVVSRDFCLAKKVNNRFRVPIGTKFYRVKIKPWTPGQSSPDTLAAGDWLKQKSDPDEKPSEDRS